MDLNNCPENYSILNTYIYPGKSILSSSLDFFSFPCRSLLGGRSINYMTQTSKECLSTELKVTLTCALIPSGYFAKRVIVPGFFVSLASLLVKSSLSLSEESSIRLFLKNRQIETEKTKLIQQIESLASQNLLLIDEICNERDVDPIMIQLKELMTEIADWATPSQSLSAEQRFYFVYFENKLLKIKTLLKSEKNPANSLSELSIKQLKIKRQHAFFNLCCRLHAGSPQSKIQNVPVENVFIRRDLELQTRTFATLTRYVENLPALLDKIQDRQHHVDNLCALLPKAREEIIEGYHKIIEIYQSTPENLDNDALQALHKEQISLDQFSTLTYLSSLLRDFPNTDIFIQPLFDRQAHIDLAAQLLVQKGLYNESEEANFFDKEEVQEIGGSFFSQMQNAKISEQCFFYIHSAAAPNTGMYRALHGTVGLHLFSHFSFNETHYRMIPTFSMMQMCVNAHGKENSIAICPTIKISKRSDFRYNAANSGRDMFNPFFGNPCPPTADGLKIRDVFEFISHDFYHVLICSQIPDIIRKTIGTVSDHVASLQQNLSPEESQELFVVPFLEMFYGRLVDMECVEFFMHKVVPSQTLFLMTLDNLLLTSTKNRMSSKISQLPLINSHEEPPSGLTHWYAIQKHLKEEWEDMPESLRRNREYVPDTYFSIYFYDFLEEKGWPQKIGKYLHEKGVFTALKITPEHITLAIELIEEEDPHYKNLNRNLSFVNHLLELYEPAPLNLSVDESDDR